MRGLEIEEADAGGGGDGPIPNGGEPHDSDKSVTPATVRPQGPEEPLPSLSGLSETERWKLILGLISKASRSSDRAEAYAEAANENSARQVRALADIAGATKDQSETLGKLMAAVTRLEVRVGTVERNGEKREGSHPAIEKLISIGLHETESLLRSQEDERKAKAVRRAQVWALVIKWAAVAGPFVGAGIYALSRMLFGVP